MGDRKIAAGNSRARDGDWQGRLVSIAYVVTSYHYTLWWTLTGGHQPLPSADWINKPTTERSLTQFDDQVSQST